MRDKRVRDQLAGIIILKVALLAAALMVGSESPLLAGDPAPVVVEINLERMVHPVSAEYVTRGISHANKISASSVLLKLNTPGGLESSMRAIIDAVIHSRVPVITYVAPSGGRAASAGFFILLSGDVAVMAAGTHAGAAHPVILGGAEISKTMETKIQNDAAAYIRSIADKRGRSAKLAEEGVRQSKSYTEKEALEGRLIDAVLNTDQDIFSNFDGKAVKRFDDSTTTLHLAGSVLQPYIMTTRERFLSRILDPNIAFILAALGLLCLYIEFTHPGMIAPGVVGAIALVLALFAFHLLPINYTGVVLILLAIGLFVMEAYVTSHGVLAAGGVVAMVIGSLILIDSPWPDARIRLATSLSVTLPLAAITVILARFALTAQRRKAVTGEAGMIDSIGLAHTDLEPEGKVMINGELWNARAPANIPRGSRVRVREVEGLTLLVEPAPEPR